MAQNVIHLIWFFHRCAVFVCERWSSLPCFWKCAFRLFSVLGVAEGFRSHVCIRVEIDSPTFTLFCFIGNHHTSFLNLCHILFFLFQDALSWHEPQASYSLPLARTSICSSSHARQCSPDCLVRGCTAVSAPQDRGHILATDAHGCAKTSGVGTIS